MDGREPTMSIFTSHSESTSSQPSGDVTTITSSDYARKCRDLMGLAQDLRDLGAEAIFPLPQVVVIGGQSSGKSSLVEAVSGINVPRDSGTCTRCPMVCTMSSDVDSWSCSIKLSYEFAPDGTPLAMGARRTEDFGPALIANKDAVELWIRRAQAAILSPHRPPSFFFNLTDAELRNNARNDTDILSFSKNAVYVNVQDPEATDLSFVDLPGLIHNADDDLIIMVRTLVESYVKGPNTLIVIAMPMSDDIENMQAVTLAGKADPEKERTIGVLTKPDILGQGATGGRERWKAVLEGRESVTRHGYYCVRLPDDDQRERGITPLEAQRNAAHFFDTTAPWDHMTERTRFGIPNFVSSISALLVDRIERNLPDLRKAVEDELALCHEEISRLPPLSNAEPSTEIILRVNEFCRDVSEAVRGDRMDRRFIQKNKARYLRYKNDIMMTTPDFRPFEDGETYGNSLVETRTASRSLSDVRHIIKQSIGWELPGEIPFEATTVLIKQYTGLWPTPSISCFEDVTGNLDILLKDLLRKHFGQYKDLEKYASDLSLQERDRCIEEALCSVQKILALESYPLFTQNFDLLASEEKKWVNKYKTTRNAWLLPQEERHSPASVLYYTRADDIPSLSPSPDPTTSPVVDRHARPTIIHFFPRPRSGSESEETPTTWTIEEELKIMAKVQAYFQVAYKRIIDYVPLTIEHELNQNFASAIAKTLLSSLFKDSEEGTLDIQGLLREDPVIERKRQYLNDRRIRLLRIKEKLDQFKPIHVV